LPVTSVIRLVPDLPIVDAILIARDDSADELRVNVRGGRVEVAGRVAWSCPAWRWPDQHADDIDALRGKLIDRFVVEAPIIRVWLGLDPIHLKVLARPASFGLGKYPSRLAQTIRIGVTRGDMAVDSEGGLTRRSQGR